MKLRQKTLYSVGGALLVLLLLVSLIVTRQSLRSFEKLEQQSLTRDMERVSNRLGDEVSDWASKLREYGQWDDTAAFVQGEYPEYPEDNILDEYMPASLGLDLLLITNNAGDIFYGKEYGADVVAPRPDLLAALQPYLTRPSDRLDPTSGMVVLPLGVAILSVIPVTNANGTAPAFGTIIGAVYLDEAAWTSLGEQVRLSVTYQALGNALPPTFQQAQGKLGANTPVVVTPLDAQMVGAYSFVRDVSGQPVGLVQVQDTRTIVQQGMQQLRLMLLSLWGVGAAFTGFVLFLLERTVLSRLSYLSRTVRGITQSGAVSTRLEATGKDELATLSSDLNSMLESIESSTQALETSRQNLEQSNRELERFAYVASHDLQEPLRKVQTLSDRLASKYGTSLSDEGKLYITRMQDAAARMRVLIQDLLTYSRVQGDSQSFTNVDLNDTVRGVVSDLEVRLEESGGHVEVGHLPTLQADPLQMRQVFQNLIGNALKFKKSDVAPLVTVSARRQADNYEITVQDNGVGFEQQYAAKIFEVFQRLHGRDSYEGTGIGLAIVRKVMEKHGGSVRAESEPGQGTCFFLVLPASSKLEQPQSSQRKELLKTRV